MYMSILPLLHSKPILLFFFLFSESIYSAKLPYFYRKPPVFLKLKSYCLKGVPKSADERARRRKGQRLGKWTSRAKGRDGGVGKRSE
jgi:hypothetical protein